MKATFSPFQWILAVGALLAIPVVCWKITSHPTAEVGHSPPDSRTRPSTVTSTNSTASAVQAAPNALWRADLRALQKREAVAWLNAMLDSGEDSPTGEGFVLGNGGTLLRAPTRRIEWLEELGRRDAEAAALQAERILNKPTTPDEWADALRWLAIGRPEARALLEEKTRTLLTYEPWRRDPTVAWLEAFDVAVHLGGTSLLPELTTLAREQDNRPASYAAFLALDRLVQNDTRSLLTALQADANLLNTREAMRGNLFARADVRDAEQRRLLESYLLASSLSPSEREAFADVFPSANFHISANLLTVAPAPDPASQSTRDTAALVVVRGWRKDARFAGLDRQLARIQARLENFVAAR